MTRRQPTTVRWTRPASSGWSAWGLMGAVLTLAGVEGRSADQGTVLSTEGQVQYSAARADWTNAVVNQTLRTSDRLRTLALSRAMVQLVELGRLRLDELTTLEVLPPRNARSRGTLDLKAGALYFFTRDRPREFDIQTPQALAASRGTEFLVSLEEGERELFVVYDGEVELSNTFGTVVVLPGEQGIVESGQPPRKTAVVETDRIVQWWLYYAAVIDPADLGFTASQRETLARSLEAYRAGDLLRALEAYPSERTPASDSERAYLASLLLSVGQVPKAEAILDEADPESPLPNAVRLMIDTVQTRGVTPLPAPKLSTEWLANSYALQSRLDLEAALAAAQEAAKWSPGFGFAKARAAELEFSFGRVPEASALLDRALEVSPRNAQAWALKGFLLSAERRWQPAADAFDRAIALDPALGNAWLGRGLLKIRGGDRDGGRADLQTAAAMEPNRSVLRSYLGKAFNHEHDVANANLELALAMELDAEDPTPWLYSALILRQQLRFNEAVTDLEKSTRLNDNRQVYRSRLLLDQDRAVRSASLATIYRAAGMDEVSVREAARAVSYDYANYSAHQFLAESYDALRDPTRFNLRNETVWFNELLLANLLKPVGAGSLSQNITQQEYSRLFEADRLGLSSVTEYRTDGQFREQASQFGTVGRFSYALDLDYQYNEGVRPNNELDRLETYFTAKYQLTSQDSLFLLMKYQDYSAGDNFQYYDPNAVTTFPGLYTNAPVIRTNYTFVEQQAPIAVGGYHREWSPGMHTLMLGGRLENDQQFSDTDTLQTIMLRFPNTPPTNQAQLFDLDYRNEFEIYTAELQQIFESDRHLTLLGGRYQGGTFETEDTLPLVNTNFAPFFNNPPAEGDFTEPFERITAYAYHTWEAVANLRLTAGVAYDYIEYPVNYRHPPVSSGSTARDQVSPKAALVWAPNQTVTVRAAYTRSLGGASFDESFRLEPTQLAGFSQAFRTLIPESVVGSVSVPSYETAGLAFDFKFPTRTYAGVQAAFLQSEVDRDIGVFQFTGTVPVTPSSTREELEYTEPSVSLTLNQLISDEWSVGAQYRFTVSQLDRAFPEVAGASQDLEAQLHQARLFALWNLPCGFFARAEALYFNQSNRGYSPDIPGDEFFQFNAFIGYRLKRQRGELSLGVLNIGDTDYNLNPLNPYAELPRERVFAVRLKFNL